MPPPSIIIHASSVSLTDAASSGLLGYSCTASVRYFMAGVCIVMRTGPL